MPVPQTQSHVHGYGVELKRKNYEKGRNYLVLSSFIKNQHNWVKYKKPPHTCFATKKKTTHIA
jgi:hypothetical protein